MQMVRQGIHRPENDDLLLQSRLRKPRLQRTYSRTQIATEKERGADADSPVVRGAGLLLVRTGGQIDGRKPSVYHPF